MTESHESLMQICAAATPERLRAPETAARVPGLNSRTVVSVPSALLIDLRVFSARIALNLHATSRAGPGISKHIGRSLPGSFEIWLRCLPLFCVCLTCSFVLVFSPPSLPPSSFFLFLFLTFPLSLLFFWGLAGRLGGFLQIGTPMNNASKAWESRELRLAISVCHSFFPVLLSCRDKAVTSEEKTMLLFSPCAFPSFD